MLQYGAQRREVSGGEPATTNNRMELRAAIAALRALREPCAIDCFTDSQYLRHGITSWIKSWKARGWRTAGKQPVKNEDLWRELDALAAKHHMKWHWLKGHAGDPLNERCDQLAAMEIARLRQRHTREQLAALRELFAAGRTPDRASQACWNRPECQAVPWLATCEARVPSEARKPPCWATVSFQVKLRS